MQLLLKLHTGGVECPSNAIMWLCQTFIASVLKEIRGNKVKSPPTNAPICDRKRTGKCSFTKAARVEAPFIKLEEGVGGTQHGQKVVSGRRIT